MQLNDVFNPSFIDPLLTKVRECMALAVTQQKHVRDAGFVKRKADNSPVSETDTAVQIELEKFLTNAAPDWGFVGEESAADWAGKGQVPELFWLVDPIDGTVEYAAGGDQFAIAVALVHGITPVFGLIAGPVSGDIFYTSSSNSVALSTPHGNANFTPPPRLIDIAGHTLITGKRCPGDVAAYRVASEHEPARHVECASALKFHAMLRGEADVYTRHRPTSEWDIAAGHALIAAQGGTCRTLEKGPLTFGHIERGFKLDSVYITR